MARMIDCGFNNDLNIEKNLLWSSIKNNLPENIICYYNYQVEGKKINFCLLIEDIGLYTIETKEWNKDQILSVFSSNEVEIRNGNGIIDVIETVHSPRLQAKSFQLVLSNILNDNYNINPPVYGIVCYPLLSENEYEKLGLRTISEPSITFFKEDISNQNDFIRKLLSVHTKFSYIKNDSMDNRIYSLCKRNFEGYILLDEIGDKNPYSILNIYSRRLSFEEIKEIIDLYVRGTKFILFVNNLDDVKKLAYQLSEKLNEINLKVKDGSFILIKNPENDIRVIDNYFNIFNFEVYCSDKFNIGKDYSIINGKINDVENDVLLDICNIVSFNMQQYLIEHSELEKDIYVKAGAGTGKTYSMVLRIAYLAINNIISGINKIDEEIAMLTFTKKAAANMKVRLKNIFMNYFSLTRNPKYLEIVSNVEKMQISTIHSFSRKIMQKTSIPLGIGTEFKTVSGIYERRSIFNRNFNEFLLKRNSEDPYFIYRLPINVSDLQKNFLKISKSLYSKGFDIKKVTINSFGKNAKSMPCINEIIHDVIIKTEIEYSQKLIDNNSLRLSEYMLYLNTSVNDNSFNSNFYCFKYMFIDEFQDTDDAQISAFLAMKKKLNYRWRLKTKYISV